MCGSEVANKEKSKEMSFNKTSVTLIFALHICCLKSSDFCGNFQTQEEKSSHSNLSNVARYANVVTISLLLRSN